MTFIGSYLTISMGEYFIVVDENDRIIGKALRSECHSNPKLIHRGIYAIPVNSRGQILLQKRSMNKDTNPGRWEIVGGHNKPGETYEKAAIREIKEELGVKVGVRKIGKMRFKSRRESEIDEIFLCRIQDATKIKFNKKEISSVKFYEPKEVLKMVRTKRRSFSSWAAFVLEKHAGKIKTT